MATNLIPISAPTITQHEIDLVTDAVKSGWVSSLGKYISLFEENFAKFCDTKEAVSVSNGTTGLHLALVAMGVGPGDEVIVPDLTFVATANVVRHAGATPVFVDIKRESLCISPSDIEAAITSKTKAIIPVHMYGHPADMLEIMRIAERHGINVIEDAAEAHGATLHGRKVGSMGHCGVFSFYGNKIITSGEGGMITTNDSNLAKRLRHLRDHAMTKTKRYWHDEVGFNYRITNLQAALGVAQLDRIDDLLQRKREIFERYRKNLGTLPGIRLNPVLPGATHVHWMVCVEFLNATEEKRDHIISSLREKGIDSRPYFYPISDMPMYQRAKTPIAHEISQRGINVPSFYDLKDEQIDYISQELSHLV